MSTVATNAGAPTSGRIAQTFMWLIKRELWEHRGRYFITPLVVSAVILLATLYGLAQMSANGVEFGENGVKIGSRGVNGSLGLFRGMHFAAFLAASMPFLAVMFFVTLHYTLDTLHADRRDRSILFWKSLPISDTETVLSKLSVAAIVSPAVAFVMALFTQLIVYVAFSIAAAAQGQDFSKIWTSLPIGENILLLAYMLIAVMLWYLPIWSWCLLVSSWAQRMVFLWATIPIGLLWFSEYQVFGTNNVGRFLGARFAGMMPAAFSFSRSAMEGEQAASLHLSDIVTPGVFFSSAQLWIGLLMTVGFVTATIWVRRYRDAA